MPEQAAGRRRPPAPWPAVSKCTCLATGDADQAIMQALHTIGPRGKGYRGTRERAAGRTSDSLSLRLLCCVWVLEVALHC